MEPRSTKFVNAQPFGRIVSKNMPATLLIRPNSNQVSSNHKPKRSSVNPNSFEDSLGFVFASGKYTRAAEANVPGFAFHEDHEAADIDKATANNEIVNNMDAEDAVDSCAQTGNYSVGGAITLPIDVLGSGARVDNRHLQPATPQAETKQSVDLLHTALKSQVCRNLWLRHRASLLFTNQAFVFFHSLEPRC
jgi:hypothetical protein